MPSTSYSRRRFIGASASLAAGAFTGPNLLLKGQNAAGKKLNLAQIGANGKGLADTGMVTLTHNIVAMVDVDQKRLDEAVQKRETHHRDSGEGTPPGAEAVQGLPQDVR